MAPRSEDIHTVECMCDILRDGLPLLIAQLVGVRLSYKLVSQSQNDCVAHQEGSEVWEDASG